MFGNQQRQKFVVAIRIRPYLQEDTKIYKPSQLQPILQSKNQTTLTIQRRNSQQKIFRFNHIFIQETQEQIYSKSQHLVDSVFQGHNATFLAYGQTGTGKTHTIFGTKSNSLQNSNKGFFHNSVYHIFDKIKQKMHGRQFAVKISFVQFYLDNIYDLIQNNGIKLQIKQTPDDGIHIKDALQIPVKSPQQLFNCVTSTIINRKTQQTSINKRSSRSHAIIQIQILQRWNQNNDTHYIKGMLKIVDLAGSQRVSKTQSFGPRLQQAKRINKQITTLGKCINLLAHNQKQVFNNKSNNTTSKLIFSKMYIPYRDSKITRYLTDTLQGKSKIMICVCISRYAIHLQQTFSSLIFASQASILKVQSKKNEIYSLTKSIQKSTKKYNDILPTNRNKLDPKILLQKQNEYNKIKKDDNGSIKRIIQQIQQIQNYLQGQGFNPNKLNQCLLQQNLLAYQKIFNVMRKKLQKQCQRKICLGNYGDQW